MKKERKKIATTSTKSVYLANDIHKAMKLRAARKESLIQDEVDEILRKELLKNDELEEK